MKHQRAIVDVNRVDRISSLRLYIARVESELSINRKRDRQLKLDTIHVGIHGQSVLHLTWRRINQARQAFLSKPSGMHHYGVVCSATNTIEEFDPGSARTLAAWLKHASRTRTESLLSKYSGERASNAFLTCPQARDSVEKSAVIPDNPTKSYGFVGKGLLPGDRGMSYQLVGEVMAHQG